MIGIDIISFKRFNKIKESDYERWNKFFVQSEWDYCFAKADPAQPLAGIFAAKEAVMKSSSEDLMGRTDRIEIHHLKSGRPIVKVDGKQSNIHVSISHTADMAVAIAIKYEG